MILGPPPLRTPSAKYEKSSKGISVAGYTEKNKLPAPHAGFVSRVTFETPGVNSTLVSSGLRIEKTPLTASSSVRSHGASPTVLHSGLRPGDKNPCSNDLKYTAPAGVEVGAAVDGPADTDNPDGAREGMFEKVGKK